MRFRPLMALLFAALAASPCLHSQPVDLFRTVATARLEVEADSSQGSLGRLSFEVRPTAGSKAGGDFTYSTLTSTGGQPFDGITRIGSLKGEVSGAWFGLGAQIQRVEEAGLLTSSQLQLSPFLTSGDWRLDLNLSRRHSDFDPFRFANVLVMQPNQTLRVSGTAEGQIDDTGVGLAFDYGGERFHTYGGYTHTSYQTLEARTDVTAIRNGTGMLGPDLFNLLASRLELRLQRMAGNRATSRAALLDSSAVLGGELLFEAWSLGVEGAQEVDHFTGNRSTTVTGLAGWSLGPNLDLTVRAGTTTSDQLGTLRFAGLGLTLRKRAPRI